MTEQPYTPDTETVRYWCTAGTGDDAAHYSACFDRFLAALRAETLRDWADGTAAALIERGAELDPGVYDGLNLSVDSARATADRLNPKETP